MPPLEDFDIDDALKVITEQLIRQDLMIHVVDRIMEDSTTDPSSSRSKKE